MVLLVSPRRIRATAMERKSNTSTVLSFRRGFASVSAKPRPSAPPPIRQPEIYLRKASVFTANPQAHKCVQMGEHRRSSQHRAGLPAGTWSLAALSVAACLCSVLGAKLLSNMFEPPGAPAPTRSFPGVAVERPRLAGSAPQVEAPAPKARNGAEVDDLPTGAIPDKLKGRAALTPCGDVGEAAER